MIYTIDTEDGQRGDMKIFTLFDGEKHQTIVESDSQKCRQRAIEALDALPSGSKIWACNLSYDLANIYQNNWHLLDMTLINGQVKTCKLAQKNISFYDTLNHWKLGVKAMGQRIGLEKIDVDGDYINVDYCRRDAEIVYQFVVSMIKRYEGLGLEIKATIGSTALSAFRTLGHLPFKNRLDFDSLSEMFDGYFGGRTEIFHTEPVSGNIWYHDINSLYPAVMAHNLYPNFDDALYTSKPDLKTEGLIHAEVRSPKHMFIPYLPVKTEKRGLLFPTGRFRGMWTSFELREAVKLGYDVKPISGYISHGTCEPFKEYVDMLYQLRLKTDDQLLKDTCKNLMNNLYGKFAQRNTVTKLVPLSQAKDVRSGARVYGRAVIYEQESDMFPKQTNVLWAAYTTAYARHKLYQKLVEVERLGGKLLYCDTDSVIYEHSKMLLENTNKLGELKLEAKADYAHFLRPKLYCFGEGYKAKGVRNAQAKEFFLTGKTSFRKPTKIREALRRGMQVNEWLVTPREIRSEYTKRIILPVGITRPVHMR